MTKLSYLLIIVAWLIFIASQIISSLIFKQPIPTDATPSDLDIIIKAIYNLQNTIYRAMGIEIMVITTVVGMLVLAISKLITLK